MTDSTNLLIDPLISLALKDGTRTQLSLPAVLACCIEDRIADWPRLRPHQEPAWHALLVQLGALAAVATDRMLPTSEPEWRSALSALTPEYPDDEPWQLVVDDWMKPAFLQPPGEKPVARADFKRFEDCADALDILVTSKNHDQKADRAVASDAEDWLYALITLQTCEGFLGAGNYGIARMNGGFASRPMLRCSAAGLGPGGRVIRDIRALIAVWDDLRERAAQFQVGDRTSIQPLLWLLPWDGANSLSLRSFHPLAVEICRRVRLSARADGYRASRAGSTAPRVDAKSALGNIGDPWIPVEIKGAKALTLTGDGYSYRRMVMLLDPRQYQYPLLARQHPVDGAAMSGLVLRASGLVRGQGKTEGFHHREVHLSATTARRFAAGANNVFVRRCEEFVQIAGNVSGKALRPALIQLVQGKAEPDWKKRENEPHTRRWLDQFDTEVDNRFFAAIDASFALDEDDDEGAAKRWSELMRDLALKVFSAACTGVPGRSENRVIAQARADRMLRSAIWKQLPLLRVSPTSNDEEVIDDAA